MADKPTNSSSSTDLGRFETRKPTLVADGRPPSMYLGKSKETSDISMGGVVKAEAPTHHEVIESRPPSAGEVVKLESSKKADVDVSEPCEGTSGDGIDAVQRPVPSSGWLGGWLGRPTQSLTAQEDKQGDSQASEITREQPQQIPDEARVPVSTGPVEDLSKQTTVPTSSSSWFGLWSSVGPSTKNEVSEEQIPVKMTENDSETTVQDASISKTDAERAVGSSWAFWSTDTNKKGAKPTENPKETGQLAVAGEASQTRPEPAKAANVKNDSKVKSNKRERPVSVEEDEPTQRTALANLPSSKVTTSQNPATAKSSPPNILLPSVKNTYQLVENPSFLQHITKLFLHGQQRPVKHVFLTKDLPKIKKALAIGIHGLFPAPLLRTVIGQPTGTSIRFANHAAAAIRRWVDQHGSIDCEIEKVALEGEGKIAERVDNLWKLLLNWIDHVRKADFIMIACHSQGVPVALMLVAKLVEFGVVSTGRIGVCAMGESSSSFYFG